MIVLLLAGDCSLGKFMSSGWSMGFVVVEASDSSFGLLVTTFVGTGLLSRLCVESEGRML